MYVLWKSCRLYDISLYKKISIFHKILLSKAVRRRFFIIRWFLEDFAKIHGKLCWGPFFNKVAAWKKTPVLVFSCEFCVIFKNNYLAEHLRTTASDILDYPYVKVASARSTLRKCTGFASILAFIHFKLILESCTNSGVYLEPYQISMMMRFGENN